VIKFVSDLRQLGGFLQVLLFPPNKTDRHDISEILLKVALNTSKQTNQKIISHGPKFSNPQHINWNHNFKLINDSVEETPEHELRDEVELDT
jgi:hypothetical protein